jgi:hypothetical protein
VSVCEQTGPHSTFTVILMQGDGGSVQQYRFYFIGPDGGHIDGPPMIVECKDDQSAVETAQQLLDGKAIEVWLLTRLIARLEPDEHFTSTPKLA